MPRSLLFQHVVDYYEDSERIRPVISASSSFLVHMSSSAFLISLYWSIATSIFGRQTEAWNTRFYLFMPIPVTVLLVLSSVIKVLLFCWWICQGQTVSFLLILYKPAPFSLFFLSVSLLSENFLTSLNGSMSLWARSWCFHKRAPLWKLWVAVVDICRRETSRTET